MAKLSDLFVNADDSGGQFGAKLRSGDVGAASLAAALRGGWYGGQSPSLSDAEIEFLVNLGRFGDIGVAAQYPLSYESPPSYGLSYSKRF